MTLSGSVVAKTNLTCGGGSSTSFSRALKPCRGHHVGLVDDVDLEAAADRREEGPLPQIASIVDAAVAGCVDLDDVDASRPLRARSRHDWHSPQARLADPSRSSGLGRGCAPRWSCRILGGPRTGMRD